MQSSLTSKAIVAPKQSMQTYAAHAAAWHTTSVILSVPETRWQRKGSICRTDTLCFCAGAVLAAVNAPQQCRAPCSRVSC